MTRGQNDSIAGSKSISQVFDAAEFGSFDSPVTLEIERDIVFEEPRPAFAVIRRHKTVRLGDDDILQSRMAATDFGASFRAARRHGSGKRMLAQGQTEGEESTRPEPRTQDAVIW